MSENPGAELATPWGMECLGKRALSTLFDGECMTAIYSGVVSESMVEETEVLTPDYHDRSHAEGHSA